MTQHLSRRSFLRSSATAGLGLTLLPAGLVRGYAANEKLNVALVGVGGRGTWFVETIPSMENVVAMCDVDDRKLAEAFKRWEEGAQKLATSPHVWETTRAAEYKRLSQAKPKTYSDFRQMLDGMDKAIDGVIVATPDHTHAVISAAAMKAGKGVFCEKPLTRTLHESRALRELARKSKVATSMGNQGTATGPFRRALELARDGSLGQIKEVHVWNDSGGADRKEPPKGEEPVPDYLKWDLWLGPAAMRPYHKEWLQRNNWRDFGTCQLGNWGSHSANLAFMALKVHDLWLSEAAKEPPPVIRVKAHCSSINRLSFPRWERIDWEIPARADLPPITITWHNGQGSGGPEIVQPLMRDAIGLPEGERKGLQWAGALLVGTKGRMVLTGHNATFCLLPDEQFKGVERGRPLTVEPSRGHEADWFAACRGGKAAWANFDYASALNEFLMLGNVATQFEDKLEFEPLACKIVNHPEADAALRREYRKGWTL